MFVCKFARRHNNLLAEVSLSDIVFALQDSLTFCGSKPVEKHHMIAHISAQNCKLIASHNFPEFYVTFLLKRREKKY